MADSAEHPDSHADQDVPSQPAAETTPDVGSSNVATLLSEETTAVIIASDATQDDVVVTHETHSEAAVTEDGAQTLSGAEGDDTDEEEPSIDELLRRAGWESRAASKSTNASMHTTKGSSGTGPPKDNAKNAVPSSQQQSSRTGQTNPSGTGPPQTAKSKT